jgi:hypothetical protein
VCNTQAPSHADVEKALHFLKRAIQLDGEKFKRLAKNDKAFSAIKDDARFKALLDV